MTFDWVQLVIACLVFVGTSIAQAVRVGFMLAKARGEIDLAISEMNNKITASIAAVNNKVSESISATKAEFNGIVMLKESECDAKVGRVYQRFDEYKNVINKDFVRVDTSILQHTESDRRMESIERKLDKLIDRLSDRVIEKISEK
jgi:hypothetical protein